MGLITQELEEKFKKYPLGSQDGKFGNAEIIAKFFNPVGAETWYITEGNKLENGDYEMFGYCNLGNDEFAEFGTILMSELENLDLPMGIEIEQDLHMPKRADLMTALIRDGVRIPNFIKDNYIENDMYIYQSIIILQPNLTDEENQQIVNKYKEELSQLSEHNVDVDLIGRKKLAYNIKNNTEGYYVTYDYYAKENDITALERQYRYDKNIIKFVTIRKELVYENEDVKAEDKNTIKFQKGTILSYEDGLKQRVQEKIINEYNDFISELKKERPQVILERAYEKVCKEEMVYVFEKKDLSVNECKALLKCPNILEDAYDEWLNSDDNFNEQLEFAVDDSVERIVKDYKKEKGKEIR